MPIRALESIRHSGMIYMPGDILRGLSVEEKNRLLSLRSAERVETISEFEEDIQEVDVDPELYKELRNDLDDNYNAEELKRAAKAVGVQFEAKDTKDKVMEAIIKQGKVDLLLEDSD